MTTDLLVIHDFGAPGGAEWADAFAGWPGHVLVPDLPGHGGAPPPVGGHHEPGDAVFHLAPLLDGFSGVVAGVGRNGHTARILAIAGRATALVLVDGLGGPWYDVPGRHLALRDLRRRILATPEALVPPGPGTADVRATMVLPSMDRAFVLESCAAVTVPALVLESPASPTPDADEIVTAFPRAAVVRVPSSTPVDLAPLVIEWWDTTSGV